VTRSVSYNTMWKLGAILTQDGHIQLKQSIVIYCGL